MRIALTSRKRYTEAEKQSILADAAASTIEQAAANSGASVSIISTWRKKAKAKNRALKHEPKAANGVANDNSKGGRLRAVIREIVREELELQLR
jgi:transposase-like protein